MTTKKEELSNVRAHNLRMLLKKEKSYAAAARKIGVDRSFISRAMNYPNDYPITAKLAERAEKALGKEKGWLDIDRNNISGAKGDFVDWEIAIDTFMAIHDYFIEIDLDPRRLDRKALKRMTEQTLATSIAYEGLSASQVKESLLIGSLRSQAH